MRYIIRIQQYSSITQNNHDNNNIQHNNNTQQTFTKDNTILLLQHFCRQLLYLQNYTNPKIYIYIHVNIHVYSLYKRTKNKEVSA